MDENNNYHNNNISIKKNKTCKRMQNYTYINIISISYFSLQKNFLRVHMDEGKKVNKINDNISIKK